MTDIEKIEMIRETMPVTQNKVYLNTGSVGPLSTLTGRVIVEQNSQALQEGRASMKAFEAFLQNLVDLRQAFADLVGAASAEIALTHHTTDGMNIIAHGLTWQPGDEVVTTNCEHPGGLLPLYVLRQRSGVVVKIVDLLSDGADPVARLEAAVTPRTRLLALSHVLWNTGDRLPLAEIAEMARRRNLLTLIDGAQAAGVMPLDLPAAGVDFYALPGQKWLCGPEGVGALYVRREQLNLVAPTFAGYLSMDAQAQHDWTGYFMPQPDARRYEVATVYRPGIKAMIENLAWLQKIVGWDWIYKRTTAVTDYARQRLQATAGVRLTNPAAPQSGLTVFNLEGYDPARVMLKLSEEDIILRFIPEPYALRISTGFFNTEGDIDRLIEALKDIQTLDPESLPVYEG